MFRFLLAVGLMAVAATVAPSQPPFEKPPSLRVKVPGKPFDPKAKPVTLTDDEAKALVKELADADADKRLNALLRVRPGAPESVVVAVLGRLSDPYFEQLPAFDGFATIYVLRSVAAECLAHLGPTTVPVVLKFAKDDANRKIRDACIDVLGSLGQNADSENWLREVFQAGRSHDRAILEAAEGWGSKGVGLLRLLIANAKVRPLDRAHAMDALGNHGDAKTDAALLRPFLTAEVWELRAAAVTALGNLKDAESLPVLEKMARELKDDNDIRLKAAKGVLAQLDRAAGDKFLLEVVKTADGMFMGYVAEQVGTRKLAAAAPFLLSALTDVYTHPREQADKALRVLTGRPDGVGYDPQKGNADLWRAVVEKK